MSAVSGGSGNAGGNSGITFTTSATQTWSGTSGGNWSTNAWSGRVPLPQDDVVVNAAFAASQTITMDMPRIGRNVSFAGVTGSPTISGSIDISVFGNMTFSSGLAAINLGTTRNVILSGRGSFTFTSGVATMQPRISLVAPGGTYTLQDNHTSTNLNPLSVQLGTLDLNDRNVTVLGFGSNFSGSTRSILLRSGLITITGSGTNAWSINSASGLTFNAGTSTIKFTDATASSITFTGSGQVYNNVWFARGVSAASNTMVGSNTFNDFKDDGSAAHSILFTAGTTTTVTTFTVSGTAGNLKTINSTTTATHNLVKSGGGTISSDYLNIQHSVATPASTWYAGVNSVNNQGVATAGSGWSFTAPASTYTIQPDGVAGKDTYYGTSFTTGGCPTCADLSIGGWGDFYYDFLEFDLTGSPTAAQTVTAQLWVYGSAPNNPAIQLKRITAAWTEVGVTSASNPASALYTNMPAFPTTANWVVTDITSLYNDWKNGVVSNFGVKLNPTLNNQTNGSIASSDNATAANRPKLVITYTP